MVWERPMGWKMNSLPAKGITPAKGLVLTESYHYATPDFKYVKESKQLGYEVYAYDPNPGLEPLFLPYKFRQKGNKIVTGSMENSYQLLTSAAVSGTFDGMINTSWDDSGLHNQMWMLSFVTSAEYSWSGSKPSLQEFETSFYKNYYGPSVADMEELYFLLNEGSYYYAWTLERNVWHHGEIGKTHLPDLPRNDNIEYDPYWNTEYKEKVRESKETFGKMERALQIIENNKKIGVSNAYDFEFPSYFLNREFDHPVFARLDPGDYVRRKKGVYTDGHFSGNPEAYESIFFPYTKAADVFVPCHFWDKRSPVFFTDEVLNASDFSIKVIGDISCDVAGPIPTTIRSSTIEQPFYDVDPNTLDEKAPFSSPDQVTVMAVDNLPAALPFESSRTFARDLYQQVFPALFGDDKDGIIERATILKNGKLTTPFEYLKNFLGQESQANNDGSGNHSGNQVIDP